MAHVADVQRSIDFYRLFGMQTVNTFIPQSGKLAWAHLRCENADLMLTLADKPIVDQQGVVFYLYADNLSALRERLLHERVNVSDISFPFYMPKGEMRVVDPDGYVLLVGQAG